MVKPLGQTLCDTAIHVLSPQCTRITCSQKWCKTIDKNDDKNWQIRVKLLLTFVLKENILLFPKIGNSRTDFPGNRFPGSLAFPGKFPIREIPAFNPNNHSTC